MYEQTCKGILKGNIGVVCRLIDNLGFKLTVIMLAGRTVTVLYIGFSYMLFDSGLTYSTGACV